MSHNTLLPIHDTLAELLDTLATQSSAVLIAPPGSGKTTRVPLAVLANAPSWLSTRRILMLEPRRLAARNAAHYMAHLLNESVGATIGYRTRLDSRCSAHTRVEVVTEGVLTRLLRDDPELSAYGLIIFDEFHERSLQADLGLVLTRESQQALRSDLRILVMSATLDTQALARHLGDCPVLLSEGRSFPVDTHYRPPGRLPWLNHMASEIHACLKQHDGSVLAFLPGESEIRQLSRLLGTLPAGTTLYPLYGLLSAEEQDRAITACPHGQRKVVLATAIAETSLTIDGVNIVVDSGLSRSVVFDANTGTSRLQTQRLSQAAAEQRRGRAGRQRAGICIRLWDREEHTRLAAFRNPEILQTDLADTVLALADWGVRDANSLGWLDAPPASAWAQAVAKLQQLNALDAQGGITGYGRQLLALGSALPLAHLLLCGRTQQRARLAADIVALLEERDPLGREHGADLTLRLQALRTGQLPDKARLHRLRARSKQLTAAQAVQDDWHQAAYLLGCAWPEQIARRRPGHEPRYLMANGRGAYLDASDPLTHHEWIVIAEHNGDTRDARIFLAAPLSISDVNALIAEHGRHQEQLRWDDATESIRASRQQFLGQILLNEQPLATPAAEQCLALMIVQLQKLQLAPLPFTEELRQWQARVCLMHRLEPERWPDVSDAALSADLADWLGPWLTGMTRLQQLNQLDLRRALTTRLDWSLQQQLDTLLPSAITVPSGSRIAIDYTAALGPTQQPILAVKLQELFGLAQAPVLAQGRIKLSLHLLSPARRPIAITSDLTSFWQGAYAEVRKDMRGRYPKHPWPDDPMTAVATRGTKNAAAR